MLPLALLADTSAVFPRELITVVVLVVLISAIGAVKTLLDIVSFFRRSPSADERYATKLELGKETARLAEELSKTEHRMIQVELRLTSALNGLTGRMDDGISTRDKKLDSILRELQGIAARIGRLEGLAEADH